MRDTENAEQVCWWEEGGMWAGHMCGVDMGVTISEAREKVVFQ